MANLNNQDDQATTYDAQQLAEEIAKGEEQAPDVNVEADYERSKQFDVSDIDRTSKGAKAADKATDSSTSVSGSGVETGDPEEFLDMAKKVNPNSDR